MRVKDHGRRLTLKPLAAKLKRRRGEATHEQLYIQKHNKGTGDRQMETLQPSRNSFIASVSGDTFADSGEQENGSIWTGASEPKREDLLYFLIGNDSWR